MQSRVGDLTGQLGALMSEPFDAVFHLASAISANARPISISACALTSTPPGPAGGLSRAGGGRAGSALHLLEFGGGVRPRRRIRCPCIEGHALPTPQSSYGIHKFICQQLVTDYTRKGYIDGRAVRLMTVSVRPGRPNGRLRASCRAS